MRRSKHFLRRYLVLQRRVAQGECRIIKIADPEMPADFLTKWLSGPKVRASIQYATNSRNHALKQPARD